MLIGDRYKIEADSLNITLYQKGNGYWRPVGFFSNIGNALDHLVDLEVAETGLRGLQTVAAKQNELYGLVKDLQNSLELLQLVRDATAKKLRGIHRATTRHKG